jgi:hypothetical protein
MKRTERVTKENLKEPHFVDWGDTSEGEPEDFETKCFVKKSDAAEFAAEMDAKRYAVWLGEIGEYVTDKGNVIVDWIYYWWSSNSDWSLDERGRGQGYPYNAQSRLVMYTPYDKSDWKGR